MSEPVTNGPGAPMTALRDKWGWVVGFGVVLSVCGLLALGNTVAATFAVVAFAGAMMIFSGVVEIVHGFQMKTWGGFFLWMLLGLLYLVAGIITFAAKPAAAAVLTLMVGAAFVASGILRIVLAMRMRQGTPWVWVVVSGIVTTLLGGMILAQWPYSGLYVLGLFLGIDLLLAGASWVGIGLALRRRG